MGLIQQHKDIAAKELKPKLQAIELIKEFSSKRKNGENTNIPIFKSDTPLNEIEYRYKNLQVAIWMSFSGMVFSLFKLITSESIMSLIICGLALTMMTIFHYRYSFLSWRARCYVKNNMSEINTASHSDFNVEIMANPRILLPQKLQ